jgi:hypothetical protein
MSLHTASSKEPAPPTPPTADDLAARMNDATTVEAEIARLKRVAASGKVEEVVGQDARKKEEREDREATPLGGYGSTSAIAWKERAMRTRDLLDREPRTKRRAAATVLRERRRIPYETTHVTRRVQIQSSLYT